MPELPEVETVATGVDRRVRNDVITAVEVSAKSEPFKTAADSMVAGLEGKRIARVHRVGKHIVFDLASGAFDLSLNRSGSDSHRAMRKLKRVPLRSAKDSTSAEATEAHAPEIPPEITAQWIVHLGMTGRLLVSDPAVPIPPHTHARLSLASGRELRFVDPRRFGRLGYYELTSKNGFAGTGREPLSISLADFEQLFRGRRTPIKAALLNQRLLQGVGNIYADEALFRAGIRPRRHAGRLTRVELGRLHKSIRNVLREAIALGGSSVSDYVDADGDRGFFQLKHRVYLRTGEPCLTCGTPIRRILIGSRGTHYCPSCQK